SAETSPLALHDALPISSAPPILRVEPCASGDLALRRAIHAAIAQRLGQVRRGDAFAVVEVGDGAGDAQDAVHAAGGQLQGVDGRSEEHTSELQSREKLV